MENEIINEVISDTVNNSLPEYVSIIIKLVVSFFQGMILGLERKLSQQAIGMRTVIIITVASCLTMIVSLYVGTAYHADAARIAAQVVSGIGFLGGGAIIKQGLNIRGLTSAATIWGASAIGLATGAGLYIPSVIAWALFMFTLVLLDKIELKFIPKERTKILFLRLKTLDVNIKELHDSVAKHGLSVQSTDIDQNIEKGKTEIKFAVRSPDETDITSLTSDIKEKWELEEINLSF